MSRTSVSSPVPPRGGNFRPHLEALEDRLAPGALPGTPGLSLLDDPWSLAAHQREAADLAAAVSSYSSSNGATQTTRPVVEFRTPTPGVVHGESTLTRTNHGITMHLTATDVPAGAYTGWIPIFNPGETVPVAAGWVAGHIVGEGGNLTFSVHLNEGEIISGHPVFPSGALEDARGQEIRMVVRYHGPAEPGRTYEQTHTFEPGVAIDYLITIHTPPA